MKTLISTLIGVIAIGATLPAFAGPDWQTIEHGRKVKLERMQRGAAVALAPTLKAVAPDADQSMDKNAQHDKMLKECTEMMKDAHQDVSVK